MTDRPPEVRPCEIQWIGTMPSHWSCDRLKHVASVALSSVDKKSHEQEEAVRLCNYVDVYYHERITSELDFMQATATPDEVRRFTLRSGDVLITKDSEAWDDIAVPAFVPSDLEGVLCGYHLAQVRPLNGLIDGEYLSRSFAARGINDQFRIAANGITRFGIGKHWIDNALFLVPPIDEQRAIAAFLDRETARIDALIEKKRRQIELLHEKRAALISHAVTKGLDSNAPMKDSGIEWLGQVPEHWRVVDLRRVASDLQTGPFGSQLHASDYVDEGIPIINPANIQDGMIVPDSRTTVDEDTFTRLRCHTLEEGDIIFGRRGEMGRCALVGEGERGFLCGTGSIRVRLRTSLVHPGFVAVFLRHPGVHDHLLIESVGSTMDNLNTTIIGRIPVALPPRKEQLDIEEQIRQHQGQVGRLVAKISLSIDRLREYREALISAAVTGKLDAGQEVA